jgi:hypothetical protein
LAEDAVDLGFIKQIAELALMKAEDLPNEEPIQGAAVAAAFQTILELQVSKALKPQVVTGGDGGLQLVWYSPVEILRLRYALKARRINVSCISQSACGI